VLAADVQVGPPGGDPDGGGRPPLLADLEAGLNDALAFPFTNAAIAMALAGTDPSGWLLDWFTVDVVYKLVVGLLGGVLIGKLLGVVVFRTPEHLRLASRGEGFVALAGTFLAYGVTEAAAATASGGCSSRGCYALRGQRYEMQIARRRDSHDGW
jgi:NhaP-type Na+/H+ or K+/H+ antiporter